MAGNDALQKYVGDERSYKYAAWVQEVHGTAPPCIKKAAYGRVPERCEASLPGAIELAGAGPFVWVTCTKWGPTLYPFSPSGLVAVTSGDPDRLTVSGHYLAPAEIMLDRDWESEEIPGHLAGRVSFDPREGDICPEDPGVKWYKHGNLLQALAALPN